MQNVVESGCQVTDSIVGGGQLLTGSKALLQCGFTSKEAHGCGPDSTALRGALMNSSALIVYSSFK